MGYHQANYKRIREAYRTKYLRAFEEAGRRMDEVHAKSDDIREIDRKLSMTGAEIALAVIGTGEDHKEKLRQIREKNEQLQARRAVLMAELGYPADYTQPPYECARCKDTGFVENEMCDCMRRELIMAAYETSGLGELMRTQSFENFDLSFYGVGEERRHMEKNLAMLQAYAREFTMASGNLLLYGGTGLGKTHLSTSIAREVIERGYDVYYTSAMNMFADFEQVRFGHGIERAAAEPDRYVNCDLLILDDLGAEATNQFTVSCLYSVLNNRINLGKPTVISTNLEGKELRERYSDRIVSRIVGEYTPLRFLGTDVRRTKLDKKKKA